MTESEWKELVLAGKSWVGANAHQFELEESVLAAIGHPTDSYGKIVRFCLIKHLTIPTIAEAIKGEFEVPPDWEG